ncbi:HpcH/HpaI aldolase family protein [Coralliovum pocilloporae]|uniref:HpcH/HpaI aldolase family protein n=1 Tax=Coralliovum pocilloporae TaxID=3066369 RepID=UPI003306CDE0
MTQSFLKMLKDGGRFYFAWSVLPLPLLAEQCARSDFDGVIIDMQHGLIAESDARDMISHIYLTGKPVVVRVPIGRFDLAGRVLDWGAHGVIAPMINDRALAETFVDAMNYPPVGQRSWGAFRTRQLQQNGRESVDFLHQANDEVCGFAMIETREALDNLEDILSVPGLDGVLVGPNDLSISLSNGKTVNSSDADLQTVLADIASACQRHGKVTAIYARDPEEAHRFRDLGFQCVAVGADMVYMDVGLNAVLSQLNS